MQTLADASLTKRPPGQRNAQGKKDNMLVFDQAYACAGAEGQHQGFLPGTAPGGA